MLLLLLQGAHFAHNCSPAVQSGTRVAFSPQFLPAFVTQKQRQAEHQVRKELQLKEQRRPRRA